MNDLTKKIQTILLTDWDPIGIGGISEAHDEYDMYIPEIKTLVLNRASQHEISMFLSSVEKERMGFVDAHSAKVSNASAKLADLINEL
jgi:hypothetical protein